MKRLSIVLTLLLIMLLFISAGTGCFDTSGTKDVPSGDIKRDIGSDGLTAEQRNLKRRYELASNPNNIWWIYCVEFAQVVYYGPVKGKVTSSGKTLRRRDGHGPAEEKKDYDGTYGHSDKYVFWFDPAGKYHQWSGHYFLTSEEVKIRNVVINIRSVK